MDLMFNDDKNKKLKTKKESKLASLKNPLIKDLKQVIIFGSISLIVLGYSLVMIFNPIGTFALTDTLNSLAKVKAEVNKVETMDRNLKENLYEVERLNKDIQDIQEYLMNTSKIRKELDSNIDFIRHLGEIVEVMKIRVDELKVMGSNEDIDFNYDETQPKYEITETTPIFVSLTSSYENIEYAFAMMFTRQLIYTHNLKMVSNLDGSVTASFEIHFTKSEENVVEDSDEFDSEEDYGEEEGI